MVFLLESTFNRIDKNVNTLQKKSTKKIYKKTLPKTQFIITSDG
jgi:hypothetical protein